MTSDQLVTEPQTYDDALSLLLWDVSLYLRGLGESTAAEIAYTLSVNDGQPVEQVGQNYQQVIRSRRNLDAFRRKMRYAIRNAAKFLPEEEPE